MPEPSTHAAGALDTRSAHPSAALRLSPTREAEIVEELSQHLDDRWRELIAGGTPPEEAERLALAEFSERQPARQRTWRRCGRRMRRRP